MSKGVGATSIIVIRMEWLDPLLLSEGVPLRTCTLIPWWLCGQKWVCTCDPGIFASYLTFKLHLWPDMSEHFTSHLSFEIASPQVMEGYLKRASSANQLPWWRLVQPSRNVNTSLLSLFLFDWLVRTCRHFQVHLRMSFQNKINIPCYDEVLALINTA